jgi:hypothetical protein
LVDDVLGLGFFAAVLRVVAAGVVLVDVMAHVVDEGHHASLEVRVVRRQLLDLGQALLDLLMLVEGFARQLVALRQRPADGWVEHGLFDLGVNPQLRGDVRYEGLHGGSVVRSPEAFEPGDQRLDGSVFSHEELDCVRSLDRFGEWLRHDLAPVRR